MNGSTAENGTTSPIHVLRKLNSLIANAVTAVEENILSHNDPILSLDNLERHPIHDRENQELSKQLKTISAAAQMLRALVDPNAYINDIMYGYHDQTALFIATQADIPNILGSEEVPVQVLSEKTGLNAEKLSRYMRNLCNCLIFKETAPNVYANNALSTIFKNEGKKALVGHCVDECRTSSGKAYEALIHPDYKDSNAANRAPFNLAYNTDLTIFQYLVEVRPDIGARSKVAMSGKHLKLGDYLSLYPWDKEGDALVVDVGGGVGGATQPIARAFPNLRVHIQDLPDSEAGFTKFWNESYPEALKAQRVTFSAHNFFEPQPIKGAEIYFLRHVIHDWPEAEAVKILANLAAVMTPASKLIIVEHVVFPTYRKPASKEQDQEEGDNFVPPEPLLANWGAAATSRLDLQVLACLNAKQRTTVEFEELADKSGLRVVKFWKNLGDLAFVECRLKYVVSL